MQTNLKRLFSLLLVLVMVLGMFPGTYATDDDMGVVGDSVFDTPLPEALPDALFVDEVAAQVGYIPEDDGTTIYGNFLGSNDMPWDIAFMNYCFAKAGIYYMPPVSDWASWVEMLVGASSDSITYYHKFTGDVYYPSMSGYIPKIADIVVLDTDSDGVADKAGVITSLRRPDDIPDTSTRQYPYDYNIVFANHANSVVMVENYQFDNTTLGFVPLGVITEMSVPQLTADGNHGEGGIGGGGGNNTEQGQWDGGWLLGTHPGVAMQVVYYKYNQVFNIDGLWGEVTNSVQNYNTTNDRALDQNGNVLDHTVYQPYFVPDQTNFVSGNYQGGIFIMQNQNDVSGYGNMYRWPDAKLPVDSLQNRSMGLQYTASRICGQDGNLVQDADIHAFLQQVTLGTNWGSWNPGDVDDSYSTYAKTLRYLGVSEDLITNYLRALGVREAGVPFTLEANGNELIPVLIWKTIIVQDNGKNNSGVGVNMTSILEVADIAQASVEYGRDQWYRDIDATGWPLPQPDPAGYSMTDFWKSAFPFEYTKTNVKNDNNEWVVDYESPVIDALSKGLIYNWAAGGSRERCGWSCDTSYACKALFGTGHGEYRHGNSAFSWSYSMGNTDTIGCGYVNYIPADDPYGGYGDNAYYFRNYWGPFDVRTMDTPNMTPQFGSALIEKVDAANTDKKLAGVEFTLYTDPACTTPVTAINYWASDDNASGTIGYINAATRKTRSDGQCTYINLRPGTYFLKETKSLDGYAGLVGYRQIYIVNGSTATISDNFYQVTNTPTKVTGTFKKNVANGTNADLAGWLFNVYTDANCTNLYSDAPMPVVTGSDGKAQIELKPGTYWVKEVGHQDTNVWNSEYLTSDTTAQRIEIVGGQAPFELTITNTYYGKLQVTKSVNAGSAEGWQFNVYSNSACTTLVTTITTDANGIAKTGKLTPGTYWVKEVVGTSPYWTYDTKTAQVTVNAKQTATAGLTFTNTQYGRLTLSKSTNTGASLGGWKFGIYTDKNCTSLATYKDGGNAYLTTDANGNATSGYLLPGTYYVKEIDESASYPYWGYTNVVKKGVVAAGADTAVSGGSFENTQYGRLSVQKATNTGAQIIGWTFNVYTDSACTNLAKDRNGNNVVLTTDANGRATSGYLLPGTYFIKEVGGTAYDEYWVMDTAAKSVAVVAGADATAVTFTNTEYGRFTLRKDTNTGASRDGWVFSVYTNSACTTPAKDKNGNNVTLTTDANGNATSGYLLPGTYYVKETGGTRYNNEYWVVDTSAKTVVVTAGTTNQTPAVFTNTQYGRVVVEKSTNTGANLNDWVFTVYTDANCRNVAKDKNGNNVTMTTDTQGDAISGYLLPGTYYVKETGGSRYADNYYWTVSTEVKTVTVVAGSDVRPAEGNGVFVNTHYGRLRIVKDMDTLELNGTKKLAGWQFRITRNSDGADMGVYTTDANGEIITDKLLPGDYTITEIIDSVNGYYYCETQNPVRSVVVAGQTSLVGGNERANVSFVNALRPMKIVLDKVNEKGEPLRGVVFSLEWSTDGRNWQRVKYSNAENVVVGNCGSAGLGSDGTLVTDANGHLEFVNLYPNIYYRVIEEATVNGYALLPEPHVIRPADVDVQTLTYDMTVVNTPGYTLPEAGVSDMSMNLMIIGGTTAAMLVLFCLFTNLSVFNRRKAIKNKK